MAASAQVFDLQRDGFLAAVVGVAQSQFDARFEILTALRETGSLRGLPPAHTREEHIEEVGETARSSFAAEIIEIKIFTRAAAILTLLFGLACGLLPIRSEQIVFLALLGVAQNFVGFGNFFELFLSFFDVAGVCIRMPLARQLTVRRFDVFLRRVFRDAQDRIIVLKIHSAFFATITFAGRSNSSPSRYPFSATSMTMSSSTPSRGAVAIASATCGSKGVPLTSMAFTPSAAITASKPRSVCSKPPRTASPLPSYERARSRLSSTGKKRSSSARRRELIIASMSRRERFL